MMSAKPPKPRACKVCETSFTPERMGAKVCSPICGAAIGPAARAVALKKALIKDKRETKQKLDAMRGKPELVKLAQKAFNGYIRARDADKPCISCGKPLQAATIGGGFDCGHYRSVGSAVHMRFVEDNAHGQCKHCNLHLASNTVNYRAGLIKRIGLQSVELIESDQTLRKYSKEGLIEMARHYNAETRIKHAHRVSA